MFLIHYASQEQSINTYQELFYFMILITFYEKEHKVASEGELFSKYLEERNNMTKYTVKSS